MSALPLKGTLITSFGSPTTAPRTLVAAKAASGADQCALLFGQRRDAELALRKH